MAAFRSMRVQGKTVEAFTRKPVLKGPWKWLLERFLELSGYRQHGFAGMQPLSVAETVAFAEVLGVPKGDSLRLFAYYMRELDKVFLEWINRKQGEPPSGTR